MFVRSSLNDAMYMRLPIGVGERSVIIVRLRKSIWIYGLRQAAGERCAKLGSTLACPAFERSLTDPCIYRPMDGEELKIPVLAHVDDTLDI